MNFGTSTSKPFSLFGSATTAAQTQPGLFGNTQPQQQQQQQGLFSTSSQQQPGSSLFGSTPRPQQSSNFFGTSVQPLGSAFGQTAQQQQQQQQQQPQPQRPFGETLQYGQAAAPNQSQLVVQQQLPPGQLSPYRSVPSQLQQVQAKWNPSDFSSPFRTYLYYNVEKEEESVKYQPEAIDDVKEWEKAVERRPGPTYVPKLFRGFEGLAARAQTQQKFLIECHAKLVAINNSLEVQMDRHKQFIATRLAESRRRHERIGRRTLALAVKVQILRNKGYVMDNAEEELKEKLANLEREVCDPSLDGRQQEVWARMIEIRERSRRIKQELEKLAPSSKDGDEPVLSEETILKAKQVLEDYDKKLRHLKSELDRMQEEYEAWEKASEVTRKPAYRSRR